jgi:hypothetical protein
LSNALRTINRMKNFWLVKREPIDARTDSSARNRLPLWLALQYSPSCCSKERLKPTSKTMKAATAVQIHHLMNLSHFERSVIFNSPHVARPAKMNF